LRPGGFVKNLPVGEDELAAGGSEEARRTNQRFQLRLSLGGREQKNPARLPPDAGQVAVFEEDFRGVRVPRAEPQVCRAPVQNQDLAPGVEVQLSAATRRL
jgi:hypothetical protein